MKNKNIENKEVSPKSLVLIASPNALIPNIESLLFYHGYNGRKIKQVFIYCTNHKAMSGIPALKLKRIVNLFDKKITIELHEPSENDDGSSPEALTNAIASWQSKINTKDLIINANGGNKLHFLAAINLINSRPGISVCYKEVEAGWLAFSSHYENNNCTVKTKGFSIDQKMMNAGLKEVGLKRFLGQDEKAKMFEPNMIVEGGCVNLLEEVKNRKVGLECFI
ncbi:MAG: hypothetical protein Q9M92_05755 [Enterobacterales bacterium]|nr:hypothetical protein [Enterobacterales bacterium]